MLLEEEKKAIEDLKDFKSIRILYGNRFIMFLEQLKKYQKATDTVLNLITKQSNILNKIEEYAKGINDKELLLILKSNEIDELINRCKEGGFLNE